MKHGDVSGPVWEEGEHATNLVVWEGSISDPTSSDEYQHHQDTYKVLVHKLFLTLGDTEPSNESSQHVSMIFFPLLSIEGQLNYIKYRRSILTVREKPTARPIHVFPQVVACIKLTNPKNTHTASQPIEYS